MFSYSPQRYLLLYDHLMLQNAEVYNAAKSRGLTRSLNSKNPTFRNVVSVIRSFSPAQHLFDEEHLFDSNASTRHCCGIRSYTGFWEKRPVPHRIGRRVYVVGDHGKNNTHFVFLSPRHTSTVDSHLLHTQSGWIRPRPFSTGLPQRISKASKVSTPCGFEVQVSNVSNPEDQKNKAKKNRSRCLNIGELQETLCTNDSITYLTESAPKAPTSSAKLREEETTVSSSTSFHSLTDLYQLMLKNNSTKYAYHVRKKFLKPQQVQCSYGFSSGDSKQTECYITWTFSSPLTEVQQNALPFTTVLDEAHKCFTVRGYGCASTRDASGKEAAKRVLEGLKPATLEELHQVFNWWLNLLKGQHGATAKETTSVLPSGAFLADVAWHWHKQPSLPTVEVQISARSYLEAVVRARAITIARVLKDAPSVPYHQSQVKTLCDAVNSSSCSSVVGSCNLAWHSDEDDGLRSPVIDSLDSGDAKWLLRDSQTLLAHYGIKEHNSFSFDSGLSKCETEWRYNTGATKSYKVIASSSTASTEMHAKLRNRLHLLEQLHMPKCLAVDQRSEARAIHDSMDHQHIEEAVESTALFLEQNPEESWSLVLPRVWAAALATYDDKYLEKLVSLFPHSMTTHNSVGLLEGCSASSYVLKNSMPKTLILLLSEHRRMPPHLWETLLDACSVLQKPRFGYNALATVTGGAKYSADETVDTIHGVTVQLDPDVFPSFEAQHYFQRFRAMLAFEFRAEMPNPGFRRGVETRSLNLGSESSFHDTLSYLTLQLCPETPHKGLRLEVHMTPAVDQFLSQTGVKESDFALVVSSERGEKPHWTEASVVRVTSVSISDGSFRLSVRRVTDEAASFSDVHSVYFCVLSSPVAIERMVAALKALCLTRWHPMDKALNKRHFSVPVRYLLLNASTQEAKHVAQRGPVPEHFIKALKKSLQNDVLSMHQRRALEVLDAYMATQQRHCDPEKSTFQSNNLTALAGVHISELDHLTPQQRVAVLAALTQRVTLIQGPPGTGKTYTACAIIDVWVKMHPHRKVLAVADSNVAADRLSEGLAQRSIRNARVGAGSTVDSKTNFCDSEFPSAFLKHKAQKRERTRYFRKLISDHQVVITTCIGSGHSMLEDVTFDRVIIDECAHSTEPASLVPLSLGCSALVLIGDYQQLTATVLSREAERRGLNISLMERLATSQLSQIVLLDVQRRMHPSIAEFPNHQFYEGRLKNEDVDDVTRPPIPGFSFPNPCVRVCLIKVEPSSGASQGLETTETRHKSEFGTIATGSRLNVTEAHLIPSILHSIFRHQSLTPSDIGILTPYRAQKCYMQRHLRKHFAPEILSVLQVDTIDGFQGKEKELIIFSAVRSNRKGDVGFLKDGRRMNVMLTRARRGLIVIADPNTLQRETKHWKRWLEWVTLRNAVIRSNNLSRYLGLIPPDPPRNVSRITGSEVKHIYDNSHGVV